MPYDSETGNFIEELATNLFPSEVGLGKTLAKTFGNQSDSYSNSIQTVSKSQADLQKLINKKKKEGKDTAKLKKIFNSNKIQLGDLNNGLAEETTFPTDQEVLGQIGGTVLDAGAGMLGRAKGASTAAKIATGGGTGYAYDVTRGMQNNKGKKSLIPGIGTIVGATIPAVLGADKMIHRGGGTVTPKSAPTPTTKGFTLPEKPPQALKDTMSVQSYLNNVKNNIDMVTTKGGKAYGFATPAEFKSSPNYPKMLDHVKTDAMQVLQGLKVAIPKELQDFTVTESNVGKILDIVKNALYK